MSFGIYGVDHVQIAVPRALEQEAIAFYRDVLGLLEIEKPADMKGRGGAWFAAGNVQFHIGIDPEGSPPSKRHVCFLVADLDEARDKAKAAGLTIEKDGPAEGLIRIFIHDPAGNRVELGQRTEA